MPPKKAPASKPAAKKTTTTGKPKPTTTTGKTKASGTTSAAADKKTAEPEKDTAAATGSYYILSFYTSESDVCRHQILTYKDLKELKYLQWP